MNTKIIAVAVVAIVAVAGIGVGLALANNDNKSSGITITDGSGKTITIDKALSNVAVINKNIPRVMVMYGIDSTITCYHWGEGTFPDIESREDIVSLGTYYTPSVETLLEKKVEAVLCPVSSMTLYASYQTACENVGIKVIRLDCNGSTLLDDMKKVSTIFGEPKKAVDVLNEYQANYDKIVEAVANKIESASAEKLDFMLCITSDQFNSVYNTSSAASNTFSKILGKNFTSYTDLSTKGVTNKFDTGTIETIHEHMDKIGILIVRPGSKDVTLTKYNTAYKQIVGDASHPVTQEAPAVANGQAYVLNSNLYSGIGVSMGLLIMAEKVYGDFSVTLTFNGTEKTYEGLSDMPSAVADFCDAYYPGVFTAGNVLAASYAAGSYSGVAFVTY